MRCVLEASIDSSERHERHMPFQPASIAKSNASSSVISSSSLRTNCHQSSSRILPQSAHMPSCNEAEYYLASNRTSATSPSCSSSGRASADLFCEKLPPAGSTSTVHSQIMKSRSLTVSTCSTASRISVRHRWTDLRHSSLLHRVSSAAAAQFRCCSSSRLPTVLTCLLGVVLSVIVSTAAFDVHVRPAGSVRGGINPRGPSLTSPLASSGNKMRTTTRNSTVPEDAIDCYHCRLGKESCCSSVSSGRLLRTVGPYNYHRYCTTLFRDVFKSEVVGRGVFMSLGEKREGCALVPDGYYKCICLTPQCNNMETPTAPCSRNAALAYNFSTPAGTSSSPTADLTTSTASSPVLVISSIPANDFTAVSTPPAVLDNRQRYWYRFREQRLRQRIKSKEQNAGAEIAGESRPKLVNFARFPNHPSSDVLLDQGQQSDLDANFAADHISEEEDHIDIDSAKAHNPHHSTSILITPNSHNDNVVVSAGQRPKNNFPASRPAVTRAPATEEEANVNDVVLAAAAPDERYDVIVAGAGRVNELSREQYSSISVQQRMRPAASSAYSLHYSRHQGISTGLSSTAAAALLATLVASNLFP